MPGEIKVHLTDRECDVLAALSKEMDLPQDRVLIMALRHFQLSRSGIAESEPVGCPAFDCDCDSPFILTKGRLPDDNSSESDQRR
jgi:hypothetical protein